MENVMIVGPDGTDLIVIDISFAREWCRLNQNCKWRRLTPEEEELHGCKTTA